jgi:hypothetical protein
MYIKDKMSNTIIVKGLYFLKKPVIAYLFQTGARHDRMAPLYFMEVSLIPDS